MSAVYILATALYEYEIDRYGRDSGEYDFVFIQSKWSHRRDLNP